MITVDADFTPQIQVARAAQIWRRSRLAIFLYVLILIPLGFGTSLATDQPYLFALIVCTFTIAGFLRWRSLLIGQPPGNPETADRWLRSCRRHTAVAGLIWGLFACYLEIEYRGVFLQFTVLLMSAGIGCFSMGVFAGDRKLTLTYLACSMIPTLAGVATGADGEAAVLVGLILIFLATVIFFQLFEINDWFVRSTVESLLLEKSRQEAEAAARVKSEFLANMSHELRTPMTGVMGMLELLLQSGLDRDQKLLVRTSHRSAEALLDTLNDILDFSRMSAGKLDFAHHDFVLRNAVEDVFDLLAPRAFEKGIDLGYRIDPAVPEWVSGDEGRLRQVLMNLVSNGIKFSHGGEWPNGGSVAVEVQLLSQKDRSVRIQFSVTDQGLGMSPATLARIFQPFVQADGSTSRRHGGTGLGLAISRQLVAAMGGDISAESEENAGAKFTFDIELQSPAHPHTITPRAACECSVLVIEPAPLSRATIGDLISRHGAVCTLVATVAEARQHMIPGELPICCRRNRGRPSPFHGPRCAPGESSLQPRSGCLPDASSRRARRRCRDHHAPCTRRSNCRGPDRRSMSASSSSLPPRYARQPGSPAIS